MNTILEQVQSGDFDPIKMFTGDKEKFLEVKTAFESISNNLTKETCMEFVISKIIPTAFNKDVDNTIRDEAVEIGLYLLNFVNVSVLSPSDQDKIFTTIEETYIKTIGDLRDNYINWDKLWIFLIRLCHEKLHSKMTVANKLLRVVEVAFRNSTSIEQRLKAYDCWTELINNCSLNMNHMCSPKQIKLLMTPMKAKFSRLPVVIMKRCDTFVYLMEKLQDKATLCLREFLEFCFGPFEDRNDEKTRQGKSVSEVCIKSTKVLISVLGHSHGEVGNCVETDDTRLAQPIINDVNFPNFAEILINSCVECCVLLTEWNKDASSINNVFKCLWGSLLKLISKSTDEVQKKCIGQISNCLRKWQERQNDPHYNVMLGNLIDLLIKDAMGENLREIMFSGALKVLEQLPSEPSPFDTESLLSFIATCFNSENKSKFDKIASNFLLSCASDTNPVVCDVWLKCNIVINSGNISLMVWPIRHFNKFPDVDILRTKWTKIYSNECKSDLIKVSIIQEIEKLFSENPLLSSGIITILHVISGAETNSSKDFVAKFMRLMELVLTFPNLSGSDIEKAGFIAVDYFDQSRSFHKSDNNEEALDKLCGCLEHLITIHKVYGILPEIHTHLKDSQQKILSKFSKRLLPFLEALMLNEDNTEISATRKLIELLEVKEKSPETAVPLTSSRSLRIINMANVTPKSNKIKQNHFNFFTDDKSSPKHLPLILKGSRTSPQVRRHFSLKKKDILHDDKSSDYVKIDTEVKLNLDKLSEHQKEMLTRRREDIPALYSDLTQSQSQDFFTQEKTQSPKKDKSRKRSRTDSDDEVPAKIQKLDEIIDGGNQDISSAGSESSTQPDLNCLEEATAVESELVLEEQTEVESSEMDAQTEDITDKLTTSEEEPARQTTSNVDLALAGTQTQDPDGENSKIEENTPQTTLDQIMDIADADTQTQIENNVEDSGDSKKLAQDVNVEDPTSAEEIASEGQSKNEILVQNINVADNETQEENSNLEEQVAKLDPSIDIAIADTQTQDALEDPETEDDTMLTERLKLEEDSVKENKQNAMRASKLNQSVDANEGQNIADSISIEENSKLKTKPKQYSRRPKLIQADTPNIENPKTNSDVEPIIPDSQNIENPASDETIQDKVEPRRRRTRSKPKIYSPESTNKIENPSSNETTEETPRPKRGYKRNVSKAVEKSESQDTNNIEEMTSDNQTPDSAKIEEQSSEEKLPQDTIMDTIDYVIQASVKLGETRSRKNKKSQKLSLTVKKNSRILSNKPRQRLKSQSKKEATNLTPESANNTSLDTNEAREDLNVSAGEEKTKKRRRSRKSLSTLEDSTSASIAETTLNSTADQNKTHSSFSEQPLTEAQTLEQEFGYLTRKSSRDAKKRINDFVVNFINRKKRSPNKRKPIVNKATEVTEPGEIKTDDSSNLNDSSVQASDSSFTKKKEKSKLTVQTTLDQMYNWQNTTLEDRNQNKITLPTEEQSKSGTEETNQNKKLDQLSEGSSDTASDIYVFKGEDDFDLPEETRKYKPRRRSMVLNTRDYQKRRKRSRKDTKLESGFPYHVTAESSMPATPLSESHTLRAVASPQESETITILITRSPPILTKEDGVKVVPPKLNTPPILTIEAPVEEDKVSSSLEDIIENTQETPEASPRSMGRLRRRCQSGNQSNPEASKSLDNTPEKERNAVRRLSLTETEATETSPTSVKRGRPRTKSLDNLEPVISNVPETPVLDTISETIESVVKAYSGRTRVRRTLSIEKIVPPDLDNQVQQLDVEKTEPSDLAETETLSPSNLDTCQMTDTDQIKDPEPIFESPSTEKRPNDLPSSPVTCDTPDRNAELLDNTCDISPIPAGLEEVPSTPKPQAEVSNLRVARLLQMVNSNVQVKREGRRWFGNKHSSPSTSKVRRMKMKKEENLDILTFSREVPSPLSTPASGILKRKFSTLEDVNVSSPKRKRVNFSDPATTAKKIFIKDVDEYGDSNELATSTKDIPNSDDIFEDSSKNNIDGDKDEVLLEIKELCHLKVQDTDDFKRALEQLINGLGIPEVVDVISEYLVNLNDERVNEINAALKDKCTEQLITKYIVPYVQSGDIFEVFLTKLLNILEGLSNDNLQHFLREIMKVFGESRINGIVKEQMTSREVEDYINKVDCDNMMELIKKYVFNLENPKRNEFLVDLMKLASSELPVNKEFINSHVSVMQTFVQRISD